MQAIALQARPARNWSTAIESMRAGAIAGLAGGGMMAIIAALLMQAISQDVWLQLKVLASLILGSEVATSATVTLRSVLVGLAVHLAISAVLGGIFALGMRRIAGLPSDLGVPEIAGLSYGLALWLIAYFGVLPLLAPALMGIYAPALIIQHLIYGAVTGLLYGALLPRPYVQLAAQRAP